MSVLFIVGQKHDRMLAWCLIGATGGGVGAAAAATRPFRCPLLAERDSGEYDDTCDRNG